METRNFTRPLLFSLCLTLAAFTATAASADEAATRSLRISYNDLDLNTSSGASALYQRIRDAAYFVCGEEGRGLQDQFAWKSCVKDAVSNAVTQMHNPLLTALDTHGAASGLQTARLTR